MHCIRRVCRGAETANEPRPPRARGSSIVECSRRRAPRRPRREQPSRECIAWWAGSRIFGRGLARKRIGRPARDNPGRLGCRIRPWQGSSLRPGRKRSVVHCVSWLGFSVVPDIPTGSDFTKGRWVRLSVRAQRFHRAGLVVSKSVARASKSTSPT